MNTYIPKDTNLNVKRTRQRQMEQRRQTDARTAWKPTKDWTDILSKFVRASFLNNSFNDDDWMKNINSISEGYKNSLKSDNISRSPDHLYINTWNTSINTIKNIHKVKRQRVKNSSLGKCMGTVNILDITAVSKLK